ncbi:MAG TPA: glutathione S-transferase family protein [Steroidobacteraceae bacterium]|jgi:glutathione S-transferase
MTFHVNERVQDALATEDQGVSMYTLYYYPFSQHARRVHALLEEARLPYSLTLVDLGKGEHRERAYQAVNPNRQVPTLLDGDFKLFESNAMLRYLCQKHGLKQWYPEDPRARARVDQWLDWNQTGLGPAVVDIVLNKVFLGSDGDKAAMMRGYGRLESLAVILAEALDRRNFITGEAPTIADLSIASNITQLGLAQSVPQVPAIERWYRHVCEIQGFAASLPPPRG